MKGLKAGIVSLGCAKNLVDTEVMLGILDREGMEIISNPAEADIIIINTCSFINSAKEESIDTILQMAEYKQQGRCKAIIVTGCLSQRYKEELLQELPEVDALLGTDEWGRIAEAVQNALAGRRTAFVETSGKIYDVEHSRIRTTPNHSAYTKIAEGCDNCCSYCVIPLVRGRFRSRKIETIIAEVKELANKGVKEINLIAQDTTSYGRDIYGSPRLVELLKDLTSIEGIRWVRLLYAYPSFFTDELIDIIANEPKICKYIDIPLQHADNTILQAMNRSCTQDEVINLLDRIRTRVSGVAIRTSFIVGFPGEDDVKFNNLFEFVKQIRFDHVGVFMYSQEEGTPAAEMVCQVPEEVKEERYHRLMELQTQISQELNHALVGKRMDVLVEGESEDQPDIIFGRTERDAPDIDGKIYMTKRIGVKPGDMVVVEISEGYAYDLSGEIVD